MSRVADLVKKAKRHIENYKKQDIFADATQAREGIDTFTRRDLLMCQPMQLKPERALTRLGSQISQSIALMQLKPERALTHVDVAVEYAEAADATQAREGIDTLELVTPNVIYVDATQAWPR